MKTLLVDNFDSFTYNLYQLLAEVNRTPPQVIRNNELGWSVLAEANFDNIVIGPGPGQPDRHKDFGVCADIIRYTRIPLLGICLGHQGLAHLCGGTVDFARQVMHGRLSQVHHGQQGLFKNIPSPFNVVRYHSLLVADSGPDLDISAQTDDGIIMGLQHKSRPQWGVQFHPESICTDFGYQLLQNFRDLTVSFWKQQSDPALSSRPYISLPAAAKTRQLDPPVDPPVQGVALSLQHRRLVLNVDAEPVFQHLFAQDAVAFWLDSSLQSDDTRFSFMGTASGPHAEWLEYDAASNLLQIHKKSSSESKPCDVLQYLRQRLSELGRQNPELPFDFNLGFAGYFGFEMKQAFGYSHRHQSGQPDAAWILADRLVVFDHVEEAIYLLGLEEEAQLTRLHHWFSSMENQLRNLAEANHGCTSDLNSRFVDPATAASELFHCERALSAEAYLEAISCAKQAIREGESYEVCLTNQVSTHCEASGFDVYRQLRHVNPAPYAGYLKFPDFEVLCSSPEKFLTIDRQGVATSKPIKGTRKRHGDADRDQQLMADLQSSEKDRAENLMIVDLLRNDLGQVCDIGSVEVDKLFAIESFASVHQMVSTIVGRVKRDTDVLECVAACFPGGSMTGAPKRRTLEILDELEPCARGIYSGSLGYLSLSGCTDLNIVIRTIILSAGVATMGVGGAIVDLSNPEEELAETVLKCQSLLTALSASRAGKLGRDKREDMENGTDGDDR